MSNQPRVAKVLATLMVSMTLGAVVLMALGNNPPSAGAFCLYAYYQLTPVKDAIVSQAEQSPTRWNSVEVFYSNTTGGDINELAAAKGLTDPAEFNCHFVIGNGSGCRDGQIQATQRWQNQLSAVRAPRSYTTSKTIKVCLVGNGKDAFPTDLQIKRLDTLIEGLYRRFDIEGEKIYYPEQWR